MKFTSFIVHVNLQARRNEIDIGGLPMQVKLLKIRDGALDRNKMCVHKSLVLDYSFVGYL